MNKDKIPFSVVTTCRNEMKSLPRWKQNILDQTRPPNEIVVVDAFSDDGTYEYLQDWSAKDSRVILIQEKGNAAKGRNTAIDNAKNEHILSTDMGVRLNDIWCEELISPFEKDNSIQVVAGNTCLDIETNKSRVAKAEHILESGGFAHLIDGHIPGNRSIAYKKKVWQEVGRLPEDLTFYADDSVFGRQLVQEQFKFDYAPKAMTYWGRPQKLKQFFRENFVYGKGDGEAFIKTPRAFRWYLEGRIPEVLTPYLQIAIQLLKKPVYKAMGRALKHFDFTSFLLIPILFIGRNYNYVIGYFSGYKNGAIKCSDCRNRLERDSKGYSIL